MSRLSLTASIKNYLLTFLLLFGSLSHGEKLEELSLPTSQLNAGNIHFFTTHAAYLRDDSNSLSLETISQSDQWLASDSSNLNLGFSRSTYWLAAKFNVTQSELQWYLRFRYALFDYIDVFVCPTYESKIKNCSVKNMGDRLTFSHRDFNHPEFVANIPFSSSQDHWIFIRTKTEGTFPFMIKVSDERTIIDDLIHNYGVRGAYIAMMLIMGLYNLFLFFSTRDRSYLYYSCFVISFLIFHMTYAGSSFQLFWPDKPEVNGFALPLLLSINMIFLSLFIPSFLNLKKLGKKSYWLFRFYLLIAVSVFALNLVLPYQVLMKILNILAMFIGISGLIIGTRFWMQGVTSARFFTIAWVAFITGLVLAASRSFGVIPLNIFTLYGYQVGSFIEILLLSLALGERISQLRKEKIQGEKALLESQEESIRHLQNYEDLYRNSISGQFQLDKHLNLIKANPSWANMVGVNLSDTKDGILSFNDFFNDQDEIEQFWSKANSDGTLKNYVLNLKPKDASESVIANITIRKGLDSEKAIWIGSAQDITESFHQEEALKSAQAERTQSLKQLVMGVAHEMNTPLGNVKMAQSFIQDSVNQLNIDQKGPLEDGLTIIEDSTETLRELGQLMKSSVVVDQEWHSEDTNLKSWVEHWSNRKKEQYSDLLIITNVDANSNYQISQLALENILDHFVVNSISHNPDLYEGKNLKLSLSVCEDKNGITFVYKDNGKGLDPDTRHDIFQPFYTTKRQAAKNKGLGLYQTYNLITEVLHGTIALPKTESGFSIQFTLPPQA